MGKLVLVRHGVTQYNLDHRFCGLTDVPLISEGINGTKALALKLVNIHFTAVFSSQLMRAYQTAEIILNENNQPDIDIKQYPQLNERDYGSLTGKSHQEVEALLDGEQVQLWRRGWEDKPPGGESLKDVYNRVMPLFKDKILPQLTNPLSAVLISAHGNSLRALIYYLDQLSLDDLAKLEIVYNEPYIYEFDQNGMHKRVDKIYRQANVG